MSARQPADGSATTATDAGVDDDIIDRPSLQRTTIIHRSASVTIVACLGNVTVSCIHVDMSIRVRTFLAFKKYLKTFVFSFSL